MGNGDADGAYGLVDPNTKYEETISSAAVDEPSFFQLVSV
jgi:hypothetical protein